MRLSIHRPLFLLAFASLACASPADPPRPSAALSRYVLADVPADVQNRTFVDFGGAVHLVGWDLEPKAVAAPGSSVRLKLYWRSVKKLSPGWSLFTHLLSPDAPKPYAFDGVGPLREATVDSSLGSKQKLSPSDWVPGKVYVDEQEITVPNEIGAPEITLAVGLFRQAMQVVGSEIEGLSDVRLTILSGLSDGKDRAIVARLATGVTPGEKRPAAARERKRKPGERRPTERPPRQPRDLAQKGAPTAPEVPKETP